MEKKKVAKIYILSMLALYFFGFVLVFLLTYFVSKNPGSNYELSINQTLAIAMLCPLIPCASYAGFCVSFSKLRQLNRAWIVALCIFFPITLIFITAFGMVMIIPSIIKQIMVLLKPKR